MPNNKKFAASFLALQMIKVQFTLNKFKSCDRFFNWFNNIQTEGYDLSKLPKSWHVSLHYYKGRYHMYNNEFEPSRVEL